MRRISTFSFLFIALMVASFNSFGQCNSYATFNSGTSTSGFTGKQTSGTASFTALAVNSQQLRTTVNGSASNYSIVSPVFAAPTSTSSIDFSFAYGDGNTASVSSVQYSVVYTNTSGAVVNTTPQTYTTSGSCVSIPRPADMSVTDNRFQVIAIYNGATGNGNVNSYISFDDFGTNGTFVGNAALPVKFSAFEAKSLSNGVALNWSVGAEANVNGYTIEKSSDGRSFSKIGFVAADGNNSYSFVDAQGAGAISYYRIRSVDNDGKINFSSIVIMKGGKAAIVLKAFPSPFINKLSVQHGTATAGSLISIAAEDGRILKSVIPALGTQQTDIDLTTAKAGLYLVRYKNGNGQVETLKILKQ